MMLNSFMMSDDLMAEYVEQWNRFKPKLVWAYTTSVYDFAKYIQRTNTPIHSPASIICTAENLTEDIRQIVQTVFNCPVLDQYGSREIGVAACECMQRKGLHTFPLNNIIEILDDDLKPCLPKQTGKIYVTTLNNYSMPLIRYDIGDMAQTAENTDCSCESNQPLIGKIIGRHIEVFKTKDGRTVPGEFFIHFIGVVFNKNFIEKFQVIQKDYDLVQIKLVVLDHEKFKQYRDQIVASIRKVMGTDCKVEFIFVNDIPRLKSGKYIYTISELN
jgi:phenylacetate-CoA ligase